MHPLILSILGTSWNKILFILVYAVLYASRCLQVASNLLQICFLESILSQIDPKLSPSWLKLGLCWPQVGSNLAQVEPMLAPDLGPQPPLSQPKPFQIPSQALQDPIKSLLPIHQAWAAGFGAWEVPFGPPKPPTWTPKLLHMAPIHSPGPVDGRSLFITDS